MNTRKKDQPFTSQLRGVAALLGDIGEEIKENIPQTLSIELITRPIEQPRRYFDPDKQKQLVVSIREHGILEPLLVRLLENGKYELVAGERRYRAALELQLGVVPVVIKELTDQDALSIALIENLQRVDLNPIEETEGILKLISLHLNQDIDKIIAVLYRMQNEAKGKVTQNVLGNQDVEKIISIFSSIGTISWESFVSSRMPLLKLPEMILEELRKGNIAYTKAVIIARIKDENQRTEILNEAIANNLSLNQIKERIKFLLKKDEFQEPTLKEKMKDAYKRLSSSPCWGNPKKKKKLEKLLAEIEMLLIDE
jgi:ParB family transcriptional regulator, chromosome partitioning protein